MQIIMKMMVIIMILSLPRSMPKIASMEKEDILMIILILTTRSITILRNTEKMKVIIMINKTNIIIMIMMKKMILLKILRLLGNSISPHLCQFFSF